MGRRTYEFVFLTDPHSSRHKNSREKDRLRYQEIGGREPDVRQTRTTLTVKGPAALSARARPTDRARGVILLNPKAALL
jgi:hypothetical protein